MKYNTVHKDASDESCVSHGVESRHSHQGSASAASAKWSIPSQYGTRTHGQASVTSARNFDVSRRTHGQADGYSSYSGLQSKLRSRAAIPSKIQWDGNSLKFDQVFQKVHGHLTQVGVSYLLSSAVMGVYMEDPEGAFSAIPESKQITYEQFLSDKEYLYGVLQSVCLYGVGSHHLQQYKDTQDGLATYISLMNEYAHGGDVSVRAAYFRQMTQLRWNPNQPLLQYLANLQTAYVHLSELDEHYSDARKISNTVQNFSGTPMHQFAFSVAKNPKTKNNFKLFCKDIREYAHSDNYGAMVTSRRRAKKTSVESFPMEDPETDQTPMEDPSVELLRHMFQFSVRQKSSENDFSIPRGAWKLLESIDPAILAKYQEQRTEILAKRKPKQPDQGQGLPRQYAPSSRNANLTVTQGMDEDASDTSSDVDVDDMVTEFANVFNSFVGNMRTIRCSVDFGTRDSQIYSMSKSSFHLAACDSGADTILFGPGWSFVEDTMRRANVIGFEQGNLERRGLTIGTRCTVVTLSNGQQVILVAHEGVDNSKNSEITLLSEYQMRDFGLIVDSVSRNHWTSSGTKGTQSITLKDPEVNSALKSEFKIPLTVRKCLMTFQIRPPTAYEYQTLPKFELSSSAPWNPDLQYSCGDPIPPVMDAESLEATPVGSQSFFTGTFDTLASTEFYYDPSDADYPCFGDPLHQIQLHAHGSPEVVADVMEYLHLLGHPDLEEPPPEPAPDPVDSFLAHLDYHELTGLPGHGGEDLLDFSGETKDGEGPSFHTFAYFAHTSCALLGRTRPAYGEAQRFQPHLGYQPLEVVRRTLEKTTQTAMSTYVSLKKHVQSRFPWLNRKRIQETVSTDTVFSKVKDVSGATCVQVFWGLTSHMINVYGLQSESCGQEAFEDFFREEGVPIIIRSDNSRMQTWKTSILKRLRELLVGTEQSTPHMQQQNPVELRAVKWLKDSWRILQRRQGSPDHVWFYGLKYLADVNNITADETLGWKIPLTIRHAFVPDISPYLFYQFYQKVYYLDHTEKFPSSKEQPGYWLGVAHTTGDILTYYILTDGTEKVLARSVVRPATADINKVRKFDPTLVKEGPELLLNHDTRDTPTDVVVEPPSQPEENILMNDLNAQSTENTPTQEPDLIDPLFQATPVPQRTIAKHGKARRRNLREKRRAKKAAQEKLNKIAQEAAPPLPDIAETPESEGESTESGGDTSGDSDDESELLLSPSLFSVDSGVKDTTDEGGSSFTSQSRMYPHPFHLQLLTRIHHH